jgi:hypothetical protein
MSDGIPSIPVQTRQEENGENERVQRIGQRTYAFLVGQLEKVLQDYFGLNTRVKEMHTEIFSLKTKLVKELPRRCMRESCDKRQPENSVTAV